MRAKGRLPKQAVVAGLVALVAVGACAAYTLRWNPEIAYFRQSHELKRAWSERMSREHGPKVMVYGGSSCEFSIDGERLLQRFNLPCVNLGRGAGMGVVTLTMAALEETRPGDTLILAVEPGLLTDPLEIPHLGIQFSVVTGHWNWIRHPLPPAEPVPWARSILTLRPGGYHVLTLIGKILSGKPLFRYSVQELRSSGWHQTPLRLEITGPPTHGIRIPDSTRQFLQSIRDWCQARNVRVAYSLPWAYTPNDQIRTFQRDNLEFLLQVADVLPVLRDPLLGAYTVREQFSDTAWHLTEEGSALRTDAFGTQIKDWTVWTRAELEQELRQRR